MRTAPFMERSNERRLAADYDGDILIWDIDKTYLDTEFGSFKGLLTIPFEFAIDKRAVPGAVPLIRALRRGPGDRSAIVPLYFVSGSPPQLRRVIERKMTLDGVEYDGITFKDQLGLAKAGRFREVKGQIGYKLTALLLYRSELPNAARWLLFGDDVESDALVFSLFGEICGDLRGESLTRRLEGLGVGSDHVLRIEELSRLLPIGPNPVERIFIHLATRRDPSELEGGPQVVATRSFLQSALVLRTMNRISAAGVGSVADSLRQNHVAEEEIEAQLTDARTRLGVPDDILDLARRR